MKLHEILEGIENCIKIDDATAVDTVTGELIDIEALAALEIERDTKIENIGLWIKNLLAEAAAIKAEKMAMAAREKAATNKAEQLKKYLADCLKGEKFKTSKLAISFRKSEVVEFNGDLLSIPNEYLRFKEPEIDKAGIKKAIKAGGVVAGCQLVAKQNIQIK